jgi:glutamate carboxypeptidase
MAKTLHFLVPLVLAATAPGAFAQPNSALLAAIEKCGPDSRALLEQVVAIDTGTGDREGLTKVGGIFAGKLRDLGGAVRIVPSVTPADGDNVVANFTGTGRGRILLITHMDTVFVGGTVAKQQPRWEGSHFIGPGAGDDKSGVVTSLCAIGALRATGFKNFARIDVLINASEELGSLGSRDLIRSMARGADVAINLERGVPKDKAIIARKGSAILTMEFAGRAAHSGLEPQNGRNAVLEAAHAAAEIGKLADPTKETSAVVTILNGGDKINVVPDRAFISADVRAMSAAEFDRVEQGAAKIAAAPTIDGVTIVSKLQRNFPPWPRNKTTEDLLARASKLYAELGKSLTGTSVGSSADVAFAAETGTPSIDGLGMEGDGAHGPSDYADFATLTPRAYLLARMLMDLGQSPPRR